MGDTLQEIEEHLRGALGGSLVAATAAHGELTLDVDAN